MYYVSMKHFKIRLSSLIHLGLTSSSKDLWFLKDIRLPHRRGVGGNKMGAQVFLVASEDIAAGIRWGLKLRAITLFRKEPFKYVSLALIF